MISRLGALSLLLLILTAGACGDSGETRTVTVERTAQATPKSQPAPAEPADDSGGDEGTKAGGNCIRVPDVVGKNHQYAQDTMQDAGLYNLSEEDATGQGRLLLYDRNWEVVEQSPRAGKCVSEDATIVLRSKKIRE